MWSLRARLALWYAAVFAVFLGAFAVAGYVYVARTSLAGVDEALAEAAEAVASALDLEARERRAPPQFVPRVVHEFRFRDMLVAVADPGGRAFYSGSDSAEDDGRAPAGGRERGPASADVPAPAETLPRPGAAAAAAVREARRRLEVPGLDALLARTAGQGEAPSFVTVPAAGTSVRVVLLPHRLAGRRLAIGVVHSLESQRRLLRRLGLALAAGVPLLLLLATSGGYLLARKSLHPVAAMTERAAQIGATTLHERLPVVNPHDELGRLAAVLNDLLARRDRAFDQQRQFMADASHELRTPIAIVSGESELALSRDDRSPAELRGALATVRGEARRMRQIVDDLFLLARANAGEPLLAPAELYLGELAGDCVQAARSLAAAKSIALSYEGSDELPLSSDEALLRRLLLNLLDNAIKYTPPGGRVTLSAEQRGDRYELRVRDDGPGIPPEAQERIFDRFFRAARAHTAAAPAGAAAAGAGLGLAIARWIAEAHGGSLVLEASDSRGSTFLVTLPAAGRQGRGSRVYGLGSSVE